MAFRGLRTATVLAVVMGTLLVASAAQASSYAVDIQIDHVPGGGSYSPVSFHWVEGENPFRLSFVHTTDSTTADLMQLAQSGTDLGNAVLHLTLLGTSTITLEMSGVRIAAVQEDGSSSGPAETVILRFREVVYTFQPLLPNGQKSGPAVTFTWRK